MINIIVAVAQNGVIGNDGKLPWKLPKDMARFKELTMGNIVIFGSNTFKEIGRVLAGRENVVLSKNIQHIDGATVFDNLGSALCYAKKLNKEIFICGGERLYKETLNIADRLYITHIKKPFDGDRFFPNLPNNFKRISMQEIEDNGLSTEFCVYEK